MFRINTRFNIQSSIVALSLVSLVVMMGSSMVTPSLTLYAKEGFGANEFLIGAVIAGFAIGRLLFDIPSGFLADKFGINRTMVLGLGVLSGASVLAGFAPTYWALLFARVLEGIGSSIYVSAAITFVLLSSGQAKRAKNIGTYQSILMLGPIVGPVVGAPIAVLFGYNAPYFAFSGMVMLALIGILIFNYRGKFGVERACYLQKEDDSNGSNNALYIGKMAVYLNTAGIATFGFAFLRSGIYTTGMPLFAFGNLSLSVFDVGVILTMASLANLVASFFSGKLTERYGMKRSMFFAILSSAILVALIPFSTTMIHLLALVTIIGVTSGFFGQSIAWAADQIEEKVREKQDENIGARKKQNKNNVSVNPSPSLDVHSHVTRGIGFNRMIGDLGLILGPLFIGYFIAAFSGDQMFWFISFGSTSIVLGIVSFLILGMNNIKKTSSMQQISDNHDAAT